MPLRPDSPILLKQSYSSSVSDTRISQSSFLPARLVSQIFRGFTGFSMARRSFPRVVLSNLSPRVLGLTATSSQRRMLCPIPVEPPDPPIPPDPPPPLSWLISLVSHLQNCIITLAKLGMTLLSSLKVVSSTSSMERPRPIHQNLFHHSSEFKSPPRGFHQLVPPPYALNAVLSIALAPVRFQKNKLFLWPSPPSFTAHVTRSLHLELCGTRSGLSNSRRLVAPPSGSRFLHQPMASYVTFHLVHLIGRNFLTGLVASINDLSDESSSEKIFSTTVKRVCLHHTFPIVGRAQELHLMGHVPILSPTSTPCDYFSNMVIVKGHFQPAVCSELLTNSSYRERSVSNSSLFGERSLPISSSCEERPLPLSSSDKERNVLPCPISLKAPLMRPKDAAEFVLTSLGGGSCLSTSLVTKFKSGFALICHRCI